jgi:hypothetical protein
VPIHSDGATDRRTLDGSDAEKVHHSDEIHPATRPRNWVAGLARSLDSGALMLLLPREMAASLGRQRLCADAAARVKASA